MRDDFLNRVFCFHYRHCSHKRGQGGRGLFGLDLPLSVAMIVIVSQITLVKYFILNRLYAFSPLFVNIHGDRDFHPPLLNTDEMLQAALVHLEARPS